jgi:signal transduction histidine kinase
MALAKLKSDFVSNVSHELRTPLALIRLYAETLELGRISTQEKKHQYYRIIRKESERLTALINNILDFSRIEAGHKEYEFRETDIAELVRNTLDSYRYQIEQQGFELDERIDSNLPPPGELINLTIFRFDDLSTLLIKLGGRSEGTFRIVRVGSPTELQNRIYQSWLGTPPK